MENLGLLAVTIAVAIGAFMWAVIAGKHVDNKIEKHQAYGPLIGTVRLAMASAGALSILAPAFGLGAYTANSLVPGLDVQASISLWLTLCAEMLTVVLIMYAVNMSRILR